MDRDTWFSLMRTTTERAYLATDSPMKQSGFSGTAARWEVLRRPVADCIDRSGSVLDVGCASGHLLECVGRWTEARGLQVELHGVDISAELVAIARRRLPELADRLWIGNALEWVPPRKLDFVRTELCYVPEEYEGRYLQHLLDHFVLDGGSLLVANYLAGATSFDGRIIPGASRTARIVERLEELGFHPSGHRDGFDRVKGRRVRVAIVVKERRESTSKEE